MEPDVLHLILCDEIQVDPNNSQRCNALGLITSIRSADASFPVVHPRLFALIVWIGGDGSGELVLRIVEGRSTSTIFRTRTRLVRFVVAQLGRSRGC